MGLIKIETTELQRVIDAAVSAGRKQSIVTIKTYLASAPNEAAKTALASLLRQFEAEPPAPLPVDIKTLAPEPESYSEPAFPRAACDGIDVRVDEAGMSLRDWFAGQALPAVIAAMVESGDIENAGAFDKISHRSFMISAAMLKRR